MRENADQNNSEYWHLLRSVRNEIYQNLVKNELNDVQPA